MTVFLWALLGGFISFLSTSLGAVLSAWTEKRTANARWNLSIDFALGLMVSASAFSLIGPAALGAKAFGHSVTGILLFAVLGAVFVYFMKNQIEHLQQERKFKTSHLILASVLMLHNFPEGLASGSALAGLSWGAALPILGGISLQNIPEGALMVVCLRSLGWNPRWAFWGGIGSGVVELFGGVLAGILLQSVQGILPALLSFAGGSMMASVVIELLEDKKSLSQRVVSMQFLLGLLCLPFLQYFLP